MNLENLNSQQRFRQELLASLDQQSQKNFPQYSNYFSNNASGKTPTKQTEEEKDYRMYIQQNQNYNNDEENDEDLFISHDQHHDADEIEQVQFVETADGMANIITSPYSKHVNPQLQQNKSRDPSPFNHQPYAEEGYTDISEIEQEIRKKKAYIWAFGKNLNGELGVQSQKDIFLPRPIQQTLKLSQTAKWISSGSHHSAIVTKAGELYVCGSQLHGKLGIPSLNVMHLTRFQQVQFQQKVKQVACGDYHTLCLMDDGTVYAWGGTLYKKTGEKSTQQNNEPRIVSGLAQRHVVSIDCGDFHSVALDSDGRLYTWGGGGAAYNKGQCGHGNNDDNENPQQIQTLSQKRIIQASAGGFHTLALCDDNELYAWGSGTYGECGLGEFQSSNKPKLCKFPKEFVSSQEMNQITDEFDFQQQRPQIIQISAGGHHSLILTAKGRVYSFGYGSHGQLGLRTTKNYASPQLVKDLISKPISCIAAGWNHSLVLSMRGDLFACGYGNHGQLGLNDKEPRTSFTHVANLGGKNVYNIFAGGNHSWVVIDDVLPIKENYRPPSPVGFQESVSPNQVSPRGGNRAALSNQKGKRKYEIGLHVTYTDTSMCHRFVTFEVSKSSYADDQRSREAIDEFIRQQYRDDQGLVYHKLQEGLDENTPVQTPFQDNENAHDEKFYTICLIYDPERSQTLKPFMQKIPKTLKQQNGSQPSKQVFFEDQDMTGNQMEYNLASWVYEFSTKVAEKFCVRRPRYSELRPSYLKSF